MSECRSYLPWKKSPGVMPTTYALFNRMVPFDLPATPLLAFLLMKGNRDGVVTLPTGPDVVGRRVERGIAYDRGRSG
jgi:hypothetical protein